MKIFVLLVLVGVCAAEGKTFFIFFADFFTILGRYIAKNKNVMLTQNPTKLPFEIENQRFSFHCLWETRNIGKQGKRG